MLSVSRNGLYFLDIIYFLLLETHQNSVTVIALNDDNELIGGPPAYELMTSLRGEGKPSDCEHVVTINIESLVRASSQMQLGRCQIVFRNFRIVCCQRNFKSECKI